MSGHTPTEQQLHRLSTFVFSPAPSCELLDWLAKLDELKLQEFLALLDQHHLLLRVLVPLEAAAFAEGLAGVAGRLRAAIATERERIRLALESLANICEQLESNGCPVVVIKTLEHWPDFGSDLDLFAAGDERQVFALLRRNFHARSTLRSLGDHLSRKRSFRLPGLLTPAEVHVNRLGQAGEHVQLGKRILARRQPISVQGYVFQIAALEERVLLTSLERIYRHLYFRICDILNLAGVLRSGQVDFAALRKVAEQNGIWPGVASCLKIAREYIASHGGARLTLPGEVDAAASLELGMLFERDGLWHFPVLPQGARLYAWELAHAIRRGDVAASARLSLLPPLASMASLAYAVTGHSGRVW